MQFVQAETIQLVKMYPQNLYVWKLESIAKHVGSIHCTVRLNNSTLRVEFGGTSMNLVQFFKNVSREMKKVSWPKGRELTSYTITVISTVVFVALFFTVIDLGISEILSSFFE